MSKCERCGHVHRTQMTGPEFKAAFKVGDRIQGWSTRKVCEITAIGVERFLYRDHRDGEYVAMIKQPFSWALASTQQATSLDKK